MKTQIGKWGNSLAVRIPSVQVKELHLTEGMDVDLAMVKEGILLRPVRPCLWNLKELVAGITPENVHGETDWGQAAGRETW